MLGKDWWIESGRPLTSTANRLVKPSNTGRVHVGSGAVRSVNQRAPPVVRSGGEEGERHLSNSSSQVCFDSLLPISIFQSEVCIL